MSPSNSQHRAASETHFSADFLRECFSYNPSTGVLSWAHRPVHHFRSASGCKTFNTANAGKPAGSLAGRYLRVNVSYLGQSYFMTVHRAILCMHEGAWPADLVDHIDGDPRNNRLENLRHASAQQNNRNRPVMPHNKSGVKGVRARKCGTFGASLRVDGTLLWLGTFKTIEAASAAHDEAAARLFGEFAYRAKEMQA